MDKLKVDEGRRSRVAVYIEEMVEASKEVVAEVAEEVTEEVAAGVKVEDAGDGDAKVVAAPDSNVGASESIAKIDESVIIIKVRLDRAPNELNRPTGTNFFLTLA